MAYFLSALEKLLLNIIFLSQIYWWNYIKDDMKRPIPNLVMLSIMLLVALNYPFLAIANRVESFGTLFLFIFIFWIVAIGLAYFFVSKKADSTDE